MLLGAQEDTHENQTQLDVAEATETQASPAAESAQGKVECDGLRACYPAAAPQHAWDESDSYDPMQWGGAAPAVPVPEYGDNNSSCSEAGSVKREHQLDASELCSNQSGRTACSSITNPSTVAIRIFSLSGSCMLTVHAYTTELRNITADSLKKRLVIESPLPLDAACIRLTHQNRTFSGNRTVFSLLNSNDRRPDRDPNYIIDLAMVRLETQET